jgi:hypothetical protein
MHCSHAANQAWAGAPYCLRGELPTARQRHGSEADQHPQQGVGGDAPGLVARENFHTANTDFIPGQDYWVSAEVYNSTPSDGTTFVSHCSFSRVQIKS